MKTLVLTSPNVKSADVSGAQKLLKNAGYYSGKVDGVYGQETAAATKAAKWGLGYADKNVTGEFGDLIASFLSGTKKPTILMNRRARIRHSKSDLGAKALSIGHQYIGVKENPPGSNEVMFSKWYGITGPWCAMFVTYCYVGAGSKSFVKGNRWAYCPFILEDAKAHRNGLKIIDKAAAVPGDIVLFDWNRDGTPDHVGMVLSPVVKGNFTSLEGNSGVGEVAVGSHDLKNVAAFIRVIN